MGLVCLSVTGCWSRSDHEVIVYSALDSEFSEPVFRDFTRDTGIVVRAKFDTEATKTVGLANAILAERDRPRCDVFWNNEILNTLRLRKQGLLQAYASPAARNYPRMYRSGKGEWYGFAGRARVLVVNTKLVPEAERPKSILDLADAKWHGKTAMAKPLFGTTATHAACLFAYWGDQQAKEFFRSLKKNEVQILSGNKQVALSVASGRAAFGITDTDDAIGEQEKAMPVAIVYPDQGQGGMGTLFIPNTVAIIAGAAHSQSARRLVDYVLSPEVEAKLATGPSAQIPLGANVRADVRVATPRTVKPMEVDFEAAAEKWDAAAQFLREEFTGT
jgi:iron(III) transport system substrate-binding protein